MTKKLVLMCLAVLLLTAPVSAGVIEDSYAKVHGGVKATASEVEQGDFEGIIIAGFVFPIWWHIYGEGSYTNMKEAGPDWSNYAGKLLFFAKNPRERQLNSYAFMAGTLTHDPDGEDEFGNTGYDAGLGVIWPMLGSRWFMEAAGKQTPERTTWTLTAGVMVGLDPGQ